MLSRQVSRITRRSPITFSKREYGRELEYVMVGGCILLLGGGILTGVVMTCGTGYVMKRRKLSKDKDYVRGLEKELREFKDRSK